MNDERNAKIVKLWNSGLSAREVAKQMGCTKNVVLGAVVKHRALGDITRPAIYSRSERSKLGNRMKKRIAK
ncbi:GcrA cell cycle regulator [uncultured Caudovirales phage]|uniref:GcrA cell cycle regulator n=1 Tax=uncultured Caudovirales phage TaxID=2100421 RepID=A0A6J5NB30_9CAUD|nr:GcrA cell cycle regulator [uncultured Caudovirales phage]